MECYRSCCRMHRIALHGSTSKPSFWYRRSSWSLDADSDGAAGNRSSSGMAMMHSSCSRIHSSSSSSSAGSSICKINPSKRRYSTETFRRSISPLPVLEMDAAGLTLEDLRSVDGQEPVLIRNAAKDFGPGADVSAGGGGGGDGDSIWDDGWRSWKQNLFERYGKKPLGYRRWLPDGSKESHWCNLGDFLGLVASRAPEKGLLAMEELLVSRDKDLWPVPLPRVLQEDFFEDIFPPDWRPPKFCLVLGTPEARSALHTDPFGWTGWNLCLQGEKVWRFIPPGQGVEAALCVQRQNQVNLSAHGESPVDLYAKTKDGTELPDLDLFPRVESLLPTIREVRQKPGDLLVFPASWWHQTLHLGPSGTFALASQHVNRHCARRVLDGIRARANLTDEIPVELLKQLSTDDAAGSGVDLSLGQAWKNLPWDTQILRLCQRLEIEGWRPRRRS
eukprot:TRINITY_DN80008_c0_g1_i1.p1 TRINITY_DN80008_c0_g1~~TRINITY_DN80008_c0_g1_i1.p1  ORF type:complete len:447 (+),score=80.97 TRINITY_DN80008_c0_g1_i1:48-1388(+)